MADARIVTRKSVERGTTGYFARDVFDLLIIAERRLGGTRWDTRQPVPRGRFRQRRNGDLLGGDRGATHGRRRLYAFSCRSERGGSGRERLSLRDESASLRPSVSAVNSTVATFQQPEMSLPS
ncbi:MAG: hypothetical protein ACRDTT_10805, partial [Pseudonocardiaceae bacterium]